jgi:hypothetical protein
LARCCSKTLMAMPAAAESVPPLGSVNGAVWDVECGDVTPFLLRDPVLT